MKGRCQRFKRGAVNRMRDFSFFVPKIFKKEESAVPTRCPEKNACIFVFRSKNFSSISQILGSHR